MSNPALIDEPITDFATEAASVMRSLRAALTSLLREVGGIRKSRDVQKLFNVDARLSWQIFKLVEPGPPLDVAKHVPSATSFRRLLLSAGKAGVSEPMLQETARAYAEFERLVETHAGDRASFDTMTRALSGDVSDNSLSELQHRRAMFKGHSHYFGAQLQTYAVTLMVHPSADDRERYDIVHLRTKLGQRRLRPNGNLVVDILNIESQDPQADTIGRVFDPAAAKLYGGPIIPQFSTSPLPELKTTSIEGTSMRLTELVGDTVGRRSAIDLTFGQIWPNTTLPPGQNGQIVVGGEVAITTPTALVNIDIFASRDAFPSAQLESAVIACENARNIPHARRPPMKLPFREILSYAGVGQDVSTLREVPNYSQLLDYVCRHMGWDLGSFDVYRWRIDYPILDTLLNFHLKV